jgi:hypothetical protein
VDPINRGQGVTESERYLAALADQTFLNLWSYPNTFIDKKGKNGGDGKELCDLLVVCGDTVIIFSDKSIGWPEHQDVNVSWARWCRRAIEKSVDQIRGAERWLKQFPERVFIDRRCTQPLPIALPPPDRARVHGVAIALGAEVACKKYYNDDDDGSLVIVAPLKGKDHTNPQAKAYIPFAVGDVDPGGPFVHVFDEAALDLVLREMDTISDFTRYLQEREKFIRGERVGHSPGEAEMLALYLQHFDPHGDHVFPMPSALGIPDDYTITLTQGFFGVFANSREYKTKKEADKISYAWDRLIGLFTENILAGTSVAIAGEEPSAARAEPALRIMAREGRTMRRALSGAFLDALESAEKAGQDRFTRVVMPSAGMADPECGYIFMILAYPTKFELKEGYEQYRRTRVAILEAYCASVLYDNRHLKRMVGIGLDASSRITGRQGGSEDLVACEITIWTPELEKIVEERRTHFDVLDAKRLQMIRMQVDEYPDIATSLRMNRKGRRAAAKRSRKASKRRGHQG